MKSDDIDDILSNIDEDSLSDGLIDFQKDGKPSLSPVEQLKIKLENKPDDDLSFLYDIDSDISNINVVLEVDAVEEMPAEEDREEKQEDEKESSVSKKKPHEALKDKDFRDKVEPAKLKIKGKSTWNTREPYTATLKTEALKADYEDLYYSFYFAKSNDKETAIIGEMKRAMFKFIRGSIKNILNDYTYYLYKNISDVAGKLGSNFGFNENKLPFFIYHLGVRTLYVILVDQLKGTKAGFCFKLTADSKVMRYVPLEFIKEMTIKWHNDNIFSAEFPFDGIMEFNELKRDISAQYMEDVEVINDKVDDLIKNSDKKSVSRAERNKIFLIKWLEIYGKDKITVYNRFIERTIFKGNR